jgi:uncharacterized protein
MSFINDRSINSKLSTLPLLELFTRLQEADLPLGISEYELLLKALQGGFGIDNRASLARLCRNLWVKSSDEDRIFSYHFEQLIGSEAEKDKPSQFDDLVKSDNGKEKFGIPLRIARKYLLIFVVATSSSVILVRSNLINYQNSSISPNPIANSKPSISPNPIASSKPSISPNPIASSKPSISPNPIASSKPSISPNPKFILDNSGLIERLGIWIVAIISTGTVFTLINRYLSNKAKSDSDQSSDNAKIVTAVQVSNRQKLKNTRQNYKDKIFISSTEFFPLTTRQIKQRWRHLRQMGRLGIPKELDLNATILGVGKEGLFLNPVLIPQRINRTQLLILIDRNGSMVPFHLLTDRLVETAAREGRLGAAGIYYFHNCPIDYLYQDPYHSQAESILSILPNFSRDRVVVLIISDAGAARGSYNPERIELTLNFLDQLQLHVRYIAWLNPMPRSYWGSTTAATIALKFPMFEFSRSGFDGAIDALRGR